MSDENFPSPVAGFLSGYQGAQESARQNLLDKANELAEQHRQALASQGILIKQLKDENTKQYQQGTLDAKTTAQNAKDRQNEIENQRKANADNILAVTRLGRLGVAQRTEIDTSARKLMEQGASTGDAMTYQQAVGQMMRSAYGDKMSPPDDHLAVPPPDASGGNTPGTAGGPQTLGQMYGAPNLRTPDMNIGSGDGNAPAAGIPPIAAGGMVGPGGATATPALNPDMSGALTMPVPGSAQGGAPTAGQQPPANPLTMPMPTGNTPPLPVMGPQQSQAGGVPPSAPPASVAPPTTGGSVAAMQQQIGQNQALPPLTMNTPQGPVGAATAPAQTDVAGSGFVLPKTAADIDRMRSQTALNQKRLDAINEEVALNHSREKYFNVKTDNESRMGPLQAEHLKNLDTYNQWKQSHGDDYLQWQETNAANNRQVRIDIAKANQALSRERIGNTLGTDGIRSLQVVANIKKQSDGYIDKLEKDRTGLKKELATLTPYTNPANRPDEATNPNAARQFDLLAKVAHNRIPDAQMELANKDDAWEEAQGDNVTIRNILNAHTRITNTDGTINTRATNRLQSGKGSVYTPPTQNTGNPALPAPLPPGMPPGSYTPPGGRLYVPTSVHPSAPAAGTNRATTPAKPKTDYSGMSNADLKKALAKKLLGN